MTNTQINPEIFKAYDIRGVYPQDLNKVVAYKIGRSYASLIQKENPNKKLKIVVGHDMRESTPQLKKHLIQGLVDSGVDVVEIGLASTPTFYFAVAYYDYDGGVEVTASHNPKEYNGFKMVRANAKPIGANTGMEEIKQAVLEENFVKAQNKGKISTKENVLQDLINEQTKGAKLDQIKPFKIVVDAANAMASLDLTALFKKLPCKLIKMNFKLDGSFPSHPADPLKEENLTALKKRVKTEGADLGIAPDGDGDRVFFVDEQGKTLRQEILRGIMAQIALKDRPGATVCYDIRPGKITLDLILAAKGKPSVTKVGHSLIKAQMIRENAVFGGESSGHYFYQFAYGTFEAPVSLITKFLHHLSQQNQPLSQVIKPYQKYYHSGEINSQVKDKQAVLEKLAKAYSDAKISYLDGITIAYPEFWFNVRPSNTEPKLRLNLEAVSPEIMKKRKQEVLQLIRS